MKSPIKWCKEAMEEVEAMQAVCEAAEGFLNDVAVWGFRDEIVVNLKAALEAYLKLKT